MCSLRNPIARITPISFVRSTTDPIIVVKIISDPIANTTAETAAENRVNRSTVSVRARTDC
jgi:hypothetical protein